MNRQELEKLKDQLLIQRADLHALEETLEEAVKPVKLDQAMVGRLSRLDAMQRQQMALETSRRGQAQLLKIEAALKRIELPDFGLCFVCGESIDIRRLGADPTNTRCISCAEQHR